MVISLAGLNQTGDRRALVKALQQCRDRLETQLRVAPVQACERIELMRLDRLDDLRIQRPLLGSGTERAIAHMTPRTTRYLSDLGSVKPAGATTVEFTGPGEGNVVDIHIEPHPDRIGGDEIVDLSCLEHADLRVARSWT